MHHPRYCLTHHPGISSNITYSRYSLQYATYATTLHTAHFTYIDATSRHTRWHVTHTSTPPTLAGLPHKHATYDTYVRAKSMSFLKLLGIQLALKFQEKIQQSLLLVFIYTAFTSQAFLSIFMKVWKTAIEKLYFFRGNQPALFKRRPFFQKRMPNLKKKKLFPNISVVSAILYILSLEKQFIKNCLYYKF